MRRIPVSAGIFVGLVTLTGLISVVAPIAVSLRDLSPKFICYLLLALLSSGLKVSLPGVTGTMSVSYLFILTALLELGLPHAVLMGLGSALVQIYWRAKRRPPLYQVLFNIAVVAIAVVVADIGLHSALAQKLGNSLPIQLFLATLGYFLANTFPIACAISLTERKGLATVWKDCYLWAFPYYLLTATIACLFHWVNTNLGWEFSLLALPAAWVLHRSFRLYTIRLEAEKERVEQEKAHVEEMNALHLRTISTLALAIEAKDQSTHNHLRRVQHYAVEIAKEMGLDETELSALRAAALLHDIGKLAVPEHIITKPGKLTPQEFERMKIHPMVGAEILEQVNFPYPVVPIVRAHHEKWDGSGYPFGLSGEQIPLSARILAAVDCFDALASDRQYRRALPLDQAMAIVVSQSGKGYDPRVVEILQRRYLALEREANLLQKPATKLSVDAKIARGTRPAAGFEEESAPEQPGDFRSQIAAAGREAQFILELASALGQSHGLAEMLSVLASRLTQLIPCDAIAVWHCKHHQLIPVYVDGKDRTLFSTLQIPWGEGLSGWVAKHKKPVLNGNPSVEPGYLNDPRKFSILRSALAIPIAGVDHSVGVLTLYRAQADAFTQEHLRILLGVSAKIGHSFENALKYDALEASATTDYLTGLNNPRALFERLSEEIARCQRQQTPLTVVVCDLDNFKEVNDRFGHSAGNEVLRTFGSELKAVSRQFDIVARLGGDEFVLVMPGVKADDIEEKAAQLSQLAAEAGRKICGRDILSSSVGAASWPDDGATVNDLLEHADARMYGHKNNRKKARIQPPELCSDDSAAQEDTVSI